MAERNLDFDKITDRRNTNCLKYDFAVKRGMPEDVLPLWVADMDFQTSSYVQDALIKQVQHGIFGYSDGQESYFEAVKGWLSIPPTPLTAPYTHKTVLLAGGNSS